MMRIHRLVALHFIENDDPNKTIVNHKDSNRLNNHYTNLEWVTYKENADHAVKQGNYAKGNNLRPVVKCNYETKEIIREYESASEASRCTGKSLAMINRICDSQRVFEILMFLYAQMGISGQRK